MVEDDWYGVELDGIGRSKKKRSFVRGEIIHNLIRVACGGW